MLKYFLVVITQPDGESGQQQEKSICTSRDEMSGNVVTQQSLPPEYLLGFAILNISEQFIESRWALNAVSLQANVLCKVIV